MSEFILSKFLFWLLGLLPGIILRLFIKVDHIARDLEIDLRSSAPIQVYLGGEVAWFCAWFRFTNKSPLTILVDRGVLQIWISQPVIDGAILKRFELLPKQTSDNILFETRLSELQQKAFLAHANRKGGDRIEPRLTLHMDTYCECKIGRFHLRLTKELYDVRAEGLPPVAP